MSGIYIHIPFCSKRCNYCDFYLITNLKVIDKFILNLKKEISISSEFFRKDKFDTVYFGGGTPSVLSFRQFEDIINHVHKYFNIESDTEISTEANPEDFLNKDKYFFREYESAGINRISFGVQSFLDSELKFLTRQHTADEAEIVIKTASEYFDNINLDIIYSLPSQTINDIDFSLTKAAKLGVKHISAYTLTFEEKTILNKQYLKKLVKKNPDSAEGEFYNFVSGKLISEGYGQYEVSNFAKKGYECRHNLKYWEYKNYLGFGPSAHSMYEGMRWNNYRDIVKYNSLQDKNILPVEEKYKLTDEQKRTEFLMLSLRSSGIDFNNYSALTGKDFKNEFADSLKILAENNFGYFSENKFRLNEKGYAVADEILAKYFL